MRAAWNAVRLAAQEVVHSAESAVRVSNLCILAALAFDADLLRGLRRRSWGPELLRDFIEHIALTPIPKLGSSNKAWTRLASLARQAALLAESAGGPDEWVAALQAVDFGRKTRGAYATPSSFANVLARVTLKPYLERGKTPRIVDPSAGTGALLLAALRVLGEQVSSRELRSIVYNIHGVEIDAASRELCCLFLWINSARAKADLNRISENIRLDNAITRDWWSSKLGAFDVLVMNPPWESLRHVLSQTDPQASSRIETISRLSIQSGVTRDLPPLFSAQGTGDRNLFKAFVELAPHLMHNGGRIGALIPAAFASDLGMAPLRSYYFKHFQLERWTSFENRSGHFQIDRRYKFGILVGNRSVDGTKSIAVRSFATEPQETSANHLTLTKRLIKKLGGPTLMLPELCNEAEVKILSRMFECGSTFFAAGSLGRVFYRREIDLTLGRAGSKFRRFHVNKLKRCGPDRFRSAAGRIYVPLVEGRMVGRYDIFQKSWISGSGRTAKWEMNEERPIGKCIPQFVAEPRKRDEFRLAICDVTSATNTRMVHASLIPPDWSCGNTAPVLSFQSRETVLAGLAILNSLVFDWMTRRLVAGVHLNKFYLANLVWPILEPAKVKYLAHLAASMVKLFPRATFDPGMRTGEPNVAIAQINERVRIEAEIEREVAMAFNLESAMLRRMFSVDQSDRRGFWRYFISNPASMNSVNVMLDRYDLHDCSPLISAVA
jgi:hypothetical protein